MQNKRQKIVLAAALVVLAVVGLNLRNSIVSQGKNNLLPELPESFSFFVQGLLENGNNPESIAPAPVNPARASLLPFRLLGTIRELNRKDSLAIIKDINTLKQGAYKEGGIISGYRIIRILRSQVHLLKDGKISKLNFPPGGASEAVLFISENEMLINRRALSKKLPDLNLNTVLKEVLALPHIESGKINGFKIAKIGNQAWSEISGLRVDDIISRVNGISLDSLRKPLQIYSELRHANEINLEIKRGSVLKNITYHIN